MKLRLPYPPSVLPHQRHQGCCSFYQEFLVSHCSRPSDLSFHLAYSRYREKRTEEEATANTRGIASSIPHHMPTAATLYGCSSRSATSAAEQSHEWFCFLRHKGELCIVILRIKNGAKPLTNTPSGWCHRLQQLYVYYMDTISLKKASKKRLTVN